MKKQKLKIYKVNNWSKEMTVRESIIIANNKNEAKQLFFRYFFIHNSIEMEKCNVQKIGTATRYNSNRVLLSNITAIKPI